MSKYTCQVRNICESYLGDDALSGYKDSRKIIKDTYLQIFRIAESTFYGSTIYSSLYTQFRHAFFESFNDEMTLAEKVLYHFYTREICAESVGLWLTWLNKRVLQIAPVYEAWFSEFGVFYGFDFQKHANAFFRDINSMETNSDDINRGGEERITKGKDYEISDAVDVDRTVNGSDTSSRNSHTGNNVYPESNLASKGYNGYKNATEKRNSSDSNTNTNIITHDEAITGARHTRENSPYEIGESKGKYFTEYKSGNKDPYGKLIERYKKATVNVQDRIIHEFDDLFLNLW